MASDLTSTFRTLAGVPNNPAAHPNTAIESDHVQETKNIAMKINEALDKCQIRKNEYTKCKWELLLSINSSQDLAQLDAEQAAFERETLLMSRRLEQTIQTINKQAQNNDFRNTVATILNSRNMKLQGVLNNLINDRFADLTSRYYVKNHHSQKLLESEQAKEKFNDIEADKATKTVEFNGLEYENDQSKEKLNDIDDVETVESEDLQYENEQLQERFNNTEAAELLAVQKKIESINAMAMMIRREVEEDRETLEKSLETGKETEDDLGESTKNLLDLKADESFRRGMFIFFIALSEIILFLDGSWKLGSTLLCLAIAFQYLF